MRPTHVISLGLSVASLVLPSQAIELDISDDGEFDIHTSSFPQVY
jgi:hypothetical protein